MGASEAPEPLDARPAGHGGIEGPAAGAGKVTGVGGVKVSAAPNGVASLVEYTFLVALIAVVRLIAISFVGSAASKKFSSVGSTPLGHRQPSPNKTLL